MNNDELIASLAPGFFAFLLTDIAVVSRSVNSGAGRLAVFIACMIFISKYYAPARMAGATRSGGSGRREFNEVNFDASYDLMQYYDTNARWYADPSAL